ncbi:exonuclease SbcCD subunit D [Halobacillus shinanisalinarum]|uniref:Nuclease SbcCD subunit D n=1 Tax=Halobacillus shinanisalinarum TaxID=2932258 RepID=A0ABY4GZZ8_9BACI|nr:exonuclease SbcCD subunit D [Halobacillus shinanisalinarum]UOQ93516.1 exonuclease SbcCD subunit D [Halobacillus shinanisalinarum]
MKILHTADWHLGKIVNNVYMTEDQEYILEQFLTIVEQQQPDVIIIAGDLYDRAIPPKQAVELLNDTFTTLINDFNIPVLAISGNHDSPDRLEFGSQLFRKQELYLDTKLSKDYQAVTIHDYYGPIHFHLIPYVEPAEVAYMFDDHEVRSHQQAAAKLIAHIKEKYNMKERHVWIGHAFLAGGMESESEERLSMIGGSPYIDANLFEAFTYVALGHLHQSQKVGKENIRYSGSILKYSFSEVNHNKSVTIVDVDEKGDTEIDKVPLHPTRDFERIEGYFDELLQGKAADNHESYLHVRLLDDGQLIDPMGKLRKVYPNILHLERVTSANPSKLEDVSKMKERQQLSPDTLFASFYQDIKDNSMSEHRTKLVREAIETLKQKERGQ